MCETRKHYELCFRVCVTAALIHSGSMGIFCRTHFCEVAKAPCMVTKARSVGHNEGNGEGMLSPLDRNVSPCPCRSQCSIQLGPPAKKHAILKYQVTLCVSHSLYHCHTSVCWLIQDCQTHRPGVVDEAPLFVLKAMNHTHSL